MRKSIKKLIVLLLSVVLVLGVTATVYARTWPDRYEDWSDDDWRAFKELMVQTQRQEIPVYDGRGGYWRDENGNYYFYGDQGYYYYGYPYNNYTGTYNSNAPGSGNGYNGAYNYSSYSYYNGILDVYDAGTEGQAQILAKIIYLYGHGVASQTAQACVGWAVLNSVDASGSGVDIGSIAPNFHYDASKPTVDDFGRDLMPLARDIIFRWKAGKAGVGSNGRVLANNFCYVWSTGSAVAFRTTPNESEAAWNYSYTTPYGS